MSAATNDIAAEDRWAAERWACSARRGSRSGGRQWWYDGHHELAAIFDTIMRYDTTYEEVRTADRRSMTANGEHPNGAQMRCGQSCSATGYDYDARRSRVRHEAPLDIRLRAGSGSFPTPTSRRSQAVDKLTVKFTLNAPWVNFFPYLLASTPGMIHRRRRGRRPAASTRTSTQPAVVPFQHPRPSALAPSSRFVQAERGSINLVRKREPTGGANPTSTRWFVFSRALQPATTHTQLPIRCRCIAYGTRGRSRRRPTRRR